MRNFLKVVLINAFIFAFFSETSLADQRCITIDWNTTVDSNVEAVQVAGAVEFAKVNGTKVLFHTQANSVKYASNKAISSKSIGCFDTSQLVIGSNVFQITFFFDSAPNAVITGVTSATFTLNKDAAEAKLLCTAVKRPGLNDGASCSASIPLSLREVDPKSADMIDIYKDEIEKLRKDLARLKGNKLQDLKDLEAKLNSLAMTDLESLNRTQLLQIDADLNNAADMIEAFKKNLSELKDTYSKDLAAQKTIIEGYRQSANESLKLDTVNVNDPEFYSQHDLASIDVSSIDLPQLTEQSDDFNEHDNVYLTLESNTMEKLKRYEAGQDWDGFNAVVSVWSNTVQFLEQALQARRETALVSEFEVLSGSVNRVKDWLSIRVDDAGFPKNSTIPESVRRTLREDIAPANAEKAKELRNAIAKWQKGLLSPQQVLVLDTVEGIGAGYRALKDTVEDDRPAIKSMLDNVLSQTIDAAKMVARVGVAFTPLNDFVDFCEVATGRSFCLPAGEKLSAIDRGVTALGLLVGTGRFWREFSHKFIKIPFEEGAEVAAKLAERLDESSKIYFVGLRKELKLGFRQESYLVRLLGSGKKYGKERMIQILSRYSKLESKLKAIPGKALDTVVSRGMKVSTAEKLDGIAKEIWSLNDYSLRADGRYGIGGLLKTGDNVIYSALGGKVSAKQLIAAELRTSSEDIVVSNIAVKLEKVLDLTDADVLRQLEVNIGEIASKLKVDETAYDVTQQLGNLAIELGFDGIKVPSVQLEGGINVIILKALK